MYIFTQPINDNLTWEIFYDSANGSLLGATNRIRMNKLVLIISISFGLDLETAMRIKWYEILNVDSENNAVVKDEFTFRKYSIPCHQTIKNIINSIYIELNYPNLESSIFNSNLLTEREKIFLKDDLVKMEWIIRGGTFKHMRFHKDYESTLVNLDFNNYPKLLFGRKVIETVGYSNETSKKLKQHFGIKLNNELFKLLNYTPNFDFKFDLSNIIIKDRNFSNLDLNYLTKINYTSNIVTLKDKNFNDKVEKYCFQKFSTFSNFLFSGPTQYQNPLTNSIRLLLIIGLYNGIRLSILLKLKWKDIIYENINEKTIELKKKIHFKGYSINIGNVDIGWLLDHLCLILQRNKQPLIFSKTNHINTYTEQINLDTPIFVTNNNTGLTQPSLLREIKKGLTYMNFPHAKKITTKSTLIMFGRKIIEIRGDHKPSINALKKHYNFRTKKELFDFLKIDYNEKKDDYEFKSKVRKTIFDEIYYDK